MAAEAREEAKASKAPGEKVVAAAAVSKEEWVAMTAVATVEETVVEAKAEAAMEVDEEA